MARWTDEATGIQMYKRGNKFYLKRPNIQKPDEFSDKKSMLAYYNTLKGKSDKLTEPQARIKRLDTQDPKWVGTTQAELDSAQVSAKIPRFETDSQEKKRVDKEKKAAEKERKAADKKAKTSFEKLQKERTPDKLASYVEKWKKLDMEVKTKTGKAKELAKRRQQSLLKQIDEAGLKQQFHEQILNQDMPDQIMIDPTTKKKYRFVGPDRNDPNSYEEI